MPHRHLIAIESPPDNHEPDDMTLGPVLPAGWDGDAWKGKDKAGNSYWLRAWNQKTTCYAIAQASTYVAARQILCADVAEGGSRKAVIKVREG